MFRFTQEPSSGSQSQCLENYKHGSIVFVDMNVISVMAAYAALTLATFLSTNTVEPYL